MPSCLLCQQSMAAWGAVPGRTAEATPRMFHGFKGSCPECAAHCVGPGGRPAGMRAPRWEEGAPLGTGRVLPELRQLAFEGTRTGDVMK